MNDKYKYVENVYKTLIVRDIIQRYKIQNPILLDNISDFLISNISNLTSYRNVTNMLNNNYKSENTNNDKKVGSYIKYLCDAFAFYRIRRFDIQGKNI